jgi:iron(III) transport system permease protein
LRPALLGSMTIVFITILNDYEAAIFLAKPNTELIGVEMLQQYAKGTPGPVAALAVVQLAITACVLALGGLLFKRITDGGRSRA